MGRWSLTMAGWWGFNNHIDLPDSPTCCTRGEHQAALGPSLGTDLGAHGDTHDRQREGKHLWRNAI